MASEVDICNLALANLGDAATVASLNPPEGSAQADHCARFYPIARNALLEMYNWSFASKRISLASLTPQNSQWLYCYAQPTDAVNLLAILDPNSPDDYSIGFPGSFPGYVWNWPSSGVYTPQPFSAEALADGTLAIYTNQANAELRYTALITDPTKFTPLFINAVASLLTSYLAGPVIKGDEGRKAAAEWRQTFKLDFGAAATSDANQRRIQATQAVDWMTYRT